MIEIDYKKAKMQRRETFRAASVFWFMMFLIAWTSHVDANGEDVKNAQVADSIGQPVTSTDMMLIAINQDLQNVPKSPREAKPNKPLVEQKSVSSNKHKRSVKKIKISKKGQRFIKKHENLSLVSYRIKGETSNTIGYGHKINSDDPLWLRRKWLGYTITRAEAEMIFQKDIDEMVIPAIESMFTELDKNGVDTDRFSQDFIDGLGSLIFNCGPTGVRTSQFYTYLKKGQMSKAIKEVKRTRIYLPGHETRRKEEMNLMLSV